jgi:hypothetical protein
MWFNEEICYQSLATCSGYWTNKDDSIQIIPFISTDTINKKTVYRKDKSGKLTVELFDQFGCRYIQPKIAYYNGQQRNFDIEFGFHKGGIPKNCKELVVWDSHGIGRMIIPLKGDSMHIQIYGIHNPVLKALQHMRLSKNGTYLQGDMYAVGQYSSGYISKEFEQKPKLKYRQWEKEEIKTSISVKNRFLDNELDRTK